MTSLGSQQTRNMEVESVEIDTYYEVAVDLVKAAGEMVMKQLKKAKKIEMKSCDVDLVTETDQEVEKLLVRSLLEQFPEHKFIGEESVADGKPCNFTDAPTWIIDPIDGTMNFVHGYPNFCISVALWVYKKPYVGIVYNPVLDQMYTARREKGAYLNGTRISVSSVKDLKQGLLSFEFGTSRDPQRVRSVMENVKNLPSYLHGIRSSGSAALNMAYVAMGGSDCYFECGIHIWDIAAGVLLVEEAGGVVRDPAGGDLDPLSRRVLCAGTDDFAQKLVPLISQYYPPRD